MAPSTDLDYEVVFSESASAKGAEAVTKAPGTPPKQAPQVIEGAAKGIKAADAVSKAKAAPRALSPNSFSPLALVILADIAESNGVIDAEALPLVRDAIMRCSAAELAALRLHTLLVRPDDEAAALWQPADMGHKASEGEAMLASPRIENARVKIRFVNCRDAAIDCAWVDFGGLEDNGCKNDMASRPWRVLPGHQLDISSGALKRVLSKAHPTHV